MKLGLLLIALALGYKVYAEASKEKGTLKSLGQWVGAIVMATALAASALMVYSFSTGKEICPLGGPGCPFARQAAVAQAK